MQYFTKKNFIIVSAIVAGVLVLISLIVAIIPKEYDAVKVSNSADTLSDIPDGYFDAFRTTLIRHLRKQKLIGENETVDDVNIREGTIYTYTLPSNNNAVASSFIVDIESVRQTYQVQVIDSKGDYNGIVAQLRCPNISDMKYPDTECVAQFGDTSKKVVHHLPYETAISGEKVVVKNIDENNTLQVYLYSCSREELSRETIIDTINSWIDSLGDDSSYEINIRTGYCEGDVI